jgi:L-threonine kinase
MMSSIGIVRSGTGSCNGSFGELLQGVLPGNKKFLVNLKIKNQSNVNLTLSSCQYLEDKESRFVESYRQYSKSYKVLRNLLTDIGCHDDPFLDVQSDIPVGKGLSSSTADMIATVKAVEKALNISLKSEYIGGLLTEIEPNDGLHWPGTAAYHHTTGTLISRFDYVPPLSILGIDFGGVVDTVQFNRIPFTWSDQEMNHYKSLLQKMEEALSSHDLKLICEIATESTLLWQRINPKAGLELVQKLQRDTGALGIINTHSGTLLGLLYDPGQADMDSLLKVVRQRLSIEQVRWFHTVSASV